MAAAWAPPPWVEAVLDYWHFALLAAVLVAAALTDLRTGKVPNWITYPAAAAGLIGHALVGGWIGAGGAEGLRIGLLHALMGLGVGFLPLFLAFLAGGIGGGDAKLMGAVGALTGWEFTLAAMFYGFLVAFLMALVTMVRRRILRSTLRRVWRFLYLLPTPSRSTDPSTPDSPRVPFAVALCVGAAVQLGDKLLGGPVYRAWPF